MDEKELIARTLKGEEEAFSTLMAQNKGRVYQHCLKIVHDEAIAEDLVQETFLHAFRHLNSFRGQARFSTWLWRIAHNLSLSYVKKQRLPEQEFKEEIAPKQQQKEDERLFLIKKAMEELDLKHRIILEYDLQGIPQKEIAARLNIPYGTVRSRLHYARKALRSLLQSLPY